MVSTSTIAAQIQPPDASSTLVSYVDSQAVIYGVNPVLANCIVSHESQWNPTNLGPEKIGVSQGLWQIYSLAHPDITRAEAFDPIWSTNWALSQIASGHVGMWSTYAQPPYYCQNIPVLN